MNPSISLVYMTANHRRAFAAPGQTPPGCKGKGTPAGLIDSQHRRNYYRDIMENLSEDRDARFLSGGRIPPVFARMPSTDE